MAHSRPQKTQDTRQNTAHMRKTVRIPSLAYPDIKGPHLNKALAPVTCPLRSSKHQRTWKNLPQTRQAYTLTGLSDTEQHFSKSNSRF